MALTVAGLAAEETIYKYQVTGLNPMNGQLVLMEEEIRFADATDSSKSWVVRRSDIRSIKDVSGTVTFEGTKPFGTYGNTYVIVMEPQESRKLVTWFGRPDTAERSRAGETSEIWMDVEHRHSQGDNCKGKLIAGPTSLRFESVTKADHSQSWDYGQIASFDKYSEANEVKVKGKSGDPMTFKTVGRGSEKPVYDIVSQRIVAARGQ
jgi:hypothetical protein